MDSFQILFFIALNAFLAFIALASRIPGLLMARKGFNLTNDWTSVPEFEQTPELQSAPPNEAHARIITPHLEAGETLEGYARGFFDPTRPQDWGMILGSKHPLLIAVTSRRILLFDLTIRRAVRRYRFIRYDEIQFLDPPKPGVMGTSGRLKFGLRSGLGYQLGFLGPLLNSEMMLEEQRLAAYLRGLAPRFASSLAA